MNGLMAKAGAGLGDALSFVGKVGYQAKVHGDLQAQQGEILGKLEQVKQGYENQRNERNNANLKQIHADSDATHLKAAEIAKSSHLEGIGLMAKAKDNKPVIVDGVAYIQHEGKEPLVIGDKTYQPGELVPATKKGDKWFANADLGLLVEENTGRTKSVGSDDPNARGLPKGTKDTDHRVTLYQKMINDHMGVGFLEKLDDAQRKEFDTLLSNGADLVRKGTDPEKAFRSTLDAFGRGKTMSGIKGDSGNNSKVQTFRDKYKY